MVQVVLNPNEDTAQGRLDKFNDFSSPLAKRVASVAKRGAQSRGLTRSTIAVGAGIGGILDQAADIAKTDSTNSVQAKIASAQNQTSLAVAATDAKSAMDIQVARDKAASERLASQLESDERQNDERISLEDRRIKSDQETNQARITSSENIALADRIAANDRAELAADVQREGISAQDDRAELAAQVQREEIASLENRSELDRQNSVFVAQLDNESRQRIEEARIEYQSTKDSTDRTDSAWTNLQAGIAQIDPNASPESQRAQFNRLMDTFDARMGFLSTVTGSTAPQQSGPTTAFAPSTLTGLAGRVVNANPGIG